MNDASVGELLAISPEELAKLRAEGKERITEFLRDFIAARARKIGFDKCAHDEAIVCAQMQLLGLSPQ